MQVKATVPVKPFIAVTVSVEVPGVPGVTEDVVPPIAKSAEGIAAIHAVMRLATFNEPNPVVWS